MADGERTKVRLDAFTAKVVPDPKNPGQCLLLTGFLGASSESKQTRIYWDPSLSSYVDVDTADIIHSEPLPKEQSPLGGSYIWVKRSAEVSMGSASGSTAKGKFFQGPLMTAYGGMFGDAAAASTAAMQVGFGAVSVGQICQITPACPPSFPGHICRFTPACPRSILLPCWTIDVRCMPIAPGQGLEEAAATPAPQAIPSLVCSYGPGCWFSWNACPTQFGCGPHPTPRCPQAVAPAAYTPFCTFNALCQSFAGVCVTFHG